MQKYTQIGEKWLQKREQCQAPCSALAFITHDKSRCTSYCALFLKSTSKMDKNLKVCAMLKVRHHKKNTLYNRQYIGCYANRDFI